MKHIEDKYVTELYENLKQAENYLNNDGVMRMLNNFYDDYYKFVEAAKSSPCGVRVNAWIDVLYKEATNLLVERKPFCLAFCENRGHDSKLGSSVDAVAIALMSHNLLERSDEWVYMLKQIKDIDKFTYRGEYQTQVCDMDIYTALLNKDGKYLGIEDINNDKNIKEQDIERE